MKALKDQYEIIAVENQFQLVPSPIVLLVAEMGTSEDHIPKHVLIYPSFETPFENVEVPDNIDIKNIDGFTHVSNLVKRLPKYISKGQCAFEFKDGIFLGTLNEILEKIEFEISISNDHYYKNILYDFLIEYNKTISWMKSNPSKPLPHYAL
ncbi:MAG: hypothetical protein IPP04_06910 [Saprospiraceae bacterium]|nr:hypothetical protein [Saprospiraceae bacterium]